GVDRLHRDRARNRHVAQELAAARIGDDGPLVADDRVVEVCLQEIRQDRTEHAAGDDDYVDSGRLDARDRPARVRSQHGVLRNQRPVEVDREGGDVPGKAFGKLKRYGVPPVDVTTNVATSAIC